MPRGRVLKSLMTVLACALALCGPAPGQTAEVPAQGRVLGLAFVGRTVGDLRRSVAFYQALGFSLDPAVDGRWHADPALASLYGVSGIRTRMARLSITNAASGRPFELYLRQIRGLKRRNLAGHSAWEPGATHFSLVVPDAPALWRELQAKGQLRARSWGAKLIAPPGQTQGRIAYITDPDGLDIELLNQRPVSPGQPAPDTPDSQPGVGHAGIVVLDSAKALAFYGDVLGGRLQAADVPWLKGDFFDSVVGGHGNIMRVYDESFPEAAAPRFHLNVALIDFQNRKESVAPFSVTDIGVGHVGFEVEGLDALLPRVLAAGAQRVSMAGIVTLGDGTRAVLIRDPDVGALLELFEQPKANPASQLH